MATCNANQTCPKKSSQKNFFRLISVEGVKENESFEVRSKCSRSKSVNFPVNDD